MRSSFFSLDGFQSPTNKTPLLSGQNAEVEKLKQELEDKNILIQQLKKTMTEISESNLLLEQDKNLAWQKAIEREEIINKLKEQIKQNEKDIANANISRKNLQLAQDRAQSSNDLKEKFKIENEHLKEVIKNHENTMRYDNAKIYYLTEREQKVNEVYKKNEELEETIEIQNEAIDKLKQELTSLKRTREITARLNENKKETPNPIPKPSVKTITLEEHQNEINKGNQANILLGQIIEKNKKQIELQQATIAKLKEEAVSTGQIVIQLKNEVHNIQDNHKVSLTNASNIINELNNNNSELTKRNKELNAQNLQLQKEQTQLKEKDDLIQLESKMPSKEEETQARKNQFYHFVAAYKASNRAYKESYGCLSIFSRHDDTGITEAENFQNTFHENMKYIRTPEDLVKCLEDLIVKNSRSLTGNYYPGSFKTYLLAYYHELSQPNKKFSSLEDITKHVESYARKHNDYVQTEFERKFTNRRRLR